MQSQQYAHSNRVCDHFRLNQPDASCRLSLSNDALTDIDDDSVQLELEIDADEHEHRMQSILCDMDCIRLSRISVDGQSQWRLYHIRCDTEQHMDRSSFIHEFIRIGLQFRYWKIVQDYHVYLI